MMDNVKLFNDKEVRRIMKRMTARRIFVSLLASSTIFAMQLGSASAAIGTLSHNSVTLTSATPSISTTYTIKFTTQQAATLTDIDFQFAKTPSGSVSVPASIDLSAATLASTTGLGAGWTIASTVNSNSTGIVSITNAGASVGAGSAATVVFNTITNPAIADCTTTGANASGTCYIRITTNAAGPAAVDQGATSFTVIAATTATATVDPSITLRVDPVNVSTAFDGITTSATSTATSLPFGNVTAGAATYDVAQQVSVYTNAQYGYTVKMAMTTPMTGFNASNHISPFNAAGVTWANPVLWTSPTGTTANTDTAWIGAHTNDARANGPGGGWVTGAGTAVFGPVSTTYNEVSGNNAPDNGTAVKVDYRVQASVYQPADTYTGTLQYNCVPTY